MHQDESVVQWVMIADFVEEHGMLQEHLVMGGPLRKIYTVPQLLDLLAFDVELSINVICANKTHCCSLCDYIGILSLSRSYLTWKSLLGKESGPHVNVTSAACRLNAPQSMTRSRC
jgi:hypothetical protein